MNQQSTYQKNSVQRKELHYSPNLLATISNSIDHCLVATIEYDGNERGVTTRDIEPMAVVYKDGKRNLVAWCRLRNDYRPFRMDRVNMIKLNKEQFTRKQDFNINDFQDDPSQSNGKHEQEG